jgi:Protein of unknown function (DUF3343).
MEIYYILVFNNTQGAIKAEAYLKSQNIKVVIMPTPTHILKSCGISIKINKEDLEKTKNYIILDLIQIKAIYEKNELGYIEHKL